MKSVLFFFCVLLCFPARAQEMKCRKYDPRMAVKIMNIEIQK